MKFYLKIHPLNITKITKKDYKKDLWKISKFFQKKEKKKKQYGRWQYKNLPEDEKQRLVDYRIKNYKMRKNASL